MCSNHTCSAMTIYEPHRWVVLKITALDETYHRVFGCWSGGYLSGDSWRVNSGIVSVAEEGNYLLFKGESGSIYRCHKGMYGTTIYGSGVLQGLIERTEAKGVQVELLDEEVDFILLC